MKVEINFPRPYDNDQPTYSASANATEHGNLFRIATPNGVGNSFIQKSVVETISEFGRLNAAQQAAIKKITEIAEETIPEKIPAKLLVIIKEIAPAFRDARFATVRYAEKTALDDASREDVPSTYDYGIAAHALANWRNLKLPEKFDAIQTWPDYAIEAVKRAGQPLSGLNPDEWKMILRRVRTINEIKRIKDTNPNFGKSPTAENPAARGFDEAKISRFIDDLDSIHASKTEALKSAESALRSTIVFCAVALGKSTHETFDILNGA